jgi:hypothetical protein
MFEELTTYIPAELGILVVALWVIGYFVKNVNVIKDAYIPFILIALGIIGSIALQGVSTLAVLQGIICAAVAVLGKNVIKQGAELLNLSDKDDDEVEAE